MSLLEDTIAENANANEKIQPVRGADYSLKYNETSVEMESRPVRWDDRFGGGGQAVPTHPWEVTEIIVANETQLFVRSGRVITEAGVFEAPVFPGASFGLINPSMVIYLKFTYADGPGELIAIEVASKLAIPADTVTEKHWVIAEVTIGTNSRDDLYVSELNQRLFEDVRLAEVDEGPTHQWKVTASTVVPDPTADDDPPPDPIPDPTQKLLVKGGTIYTQSTFAGFPVPDDDTLVAVTGTIMLKCTRLTETRALETAVFTMEPTASLPDDDEYYQYIPIADVVVEAGLITSILQRKFEDIPIFEDLVVIDGAFKFAPLAMQGRSPYALP